MKYLDYLGDSYSEESQEFDSEKAKRFAFKERGNLNIVLMGATGTGKSSLVNAMFGSNVVKSGSGEPVTQYLEKIHVPAKGITLWDTKGIEAKDYQETLEQLKDDLRNGFEQAFSSGKDEDSPHVAWLCIKETSDRIESRDKELLGILKEFKIPTVVVFTHSLGLEKGDHFFREAINILNNEYKQFLQNRFVQVNSIAEKMKRGNVIEKFGLENLLEKTEECLKDIERCTNFQKEKYLETLRRAQQVDIEKKKKAMIDGAEKAIHFAAAAAGTIGASPIPGSDAPIIAAIQTKMIHSINANFEVDMAASMAVSTIMGILGVTAVAQAGKLIVSNALKFIPIAGSLVGGAISAATAVALTESIGFSYVKVMEYFFDEKECRVILPYDTESILNIFKEVFKQ